MKVWIVIKTSWNGEFDVDTIVKVCDTENKAQQAVGEMRNKAGESSYAPSFEYEEHEVE